MNVSIFKQKYCVIDSRNQNVKGIIAFIEVRLLYFYTHILN